MLPLRATTGTRQLGSFLQGVVTLTLLTILAASVIAPIGPPEIGIEGPEENWSKSRGDGKAPRVPNANFYNERAYPLKAIPRAEWKRAQLQAAALQATASGTATWTQRGPTNVGGRITDIAVHPTNEDIAYIGAAEGGVLRTDDGGQTWTPLFDDQASISIGALAIDPTDPTVVYAGTGEVNPGGGSVAYGGTGLYRSADEGQTWQNIGLEDSGSIGRIRIDPTNPDRIVVAVMGHLWESGTDRGIYRTEDGGATWQQVLYVNDTTGCVDLIMRPDNPNIMYAAMWQRLRQPEFYDYGGSSCAVYRSTNGGDSWILVGGGLPTPNSNSGRIGLSLCASQPDVMHVIYADRTGFFDGLYRSTNGGFTWSQTNDGSLSNAFASYGWWFGNVRTHPDDPNTIFVVGFEFYRSTNGGGSYSVTSGGMHVDHHALDFGPGPNYVMFEGNDGGAYRSTNGGSAWTKLTDLPITQAYRIALDANNPDALFLGSQDNSTCRTQNGLIDDWDVIYVGDGFQPLVHPEDSNRVWAQYQYGNIGYSSNGGNSFSGANGGISGADRKNWNAPHAQDPTNANTRYFGTNRVYRNSGNTSWNVISPDLTGGPYSGNNGQVNGTLTTLSVSPADADVIWSGADDGMVHVTTNGGTTWTDVSSGLPTRWITAVRADPFDAATAYVTVSGFRWAEPLPHVYRTTNSGSTWEPIAGNLPEAPVNDLAIDPNNASHLMVGTDLGVYETWNDGTTWTVMGVGLPNVVTTSLAIDGAGTQLYAGTYGRSVFSIAIEDSQCLWDLSGDDVIAVEDLLQLLSAWGPNPGHPADFDGDDVVGVADLLTLLANWGVCP